MPVILLSTGVVETLRLGCVCFVFVCIVNCVLISFLYRSVIPKEFQCTCTGQHVFRREKVQGSPEGANCFRP